MNELLNYVSDPTNPEYTFSLGLGYEDKGQLAAAAGMYLRTAEFSDDDLLAYESLLRIASCYVRLGNHVSMVKCLLHRAISLKPERPEAYFLLSRLYESTSEWHESYSFAVMGQRLCGDHPRLRTNVEFPGTYALVFQQAVASWWIGLYDEALHLFRQLKRNPTMLPTHVLAVQDNLRRLENTLWRNPPTYHAHMYERLRVKFPGAKGIERNYSQVYQDMFVLTMLNGKRNGSFFEIGCDDPTYLSNTRLLEEFGWTGTSIDRDPADTAKWAGQRKAKVITADALQLDYGEMIQQDYDYLQIDIEPPRQSMEVLLRIPFEKHRFAVITFEHDDYLCHDDQARERSRQYLRSHGYVMVVGDIAPAPHVNFEDWWVHPDLVDRKLIEKMLDESEGAKMVERYMLTKPSVTIGRG
jgi:hypothetical protein